MRAHPSYEGVVFLGDSLPLRWPSSLLATDIAISNHQYGITLRPRSQSLLANHEPEGVLQKRSINDAA